MTHLSARTTFDKPSSSAADMQQDKVSAALYLIENAVGLFGDKFAVVSSFGAESAVLLHLTSRVDPACPVLFLNTGKLFGETKKYRDSLITHLGLTGVVTLTPETEKLAEEDPNGTLWANNTDACCGLRKVMPLQQALKGFHAWASGQKRYQSLSRATLPELELTGAKLKLNPLAGWTAEDITAYLTDYDLPRHPLVSQGYPSIGCIPCTDPVTPEDSDSSGRSGRWKGQDKTECGIHRPQATALKISSH